MMAEETFCCLGRPMLFTSGFDEQTGEFVYRDPTKEEWDSYLELRERWGRASEAIRNSDDFHFYYYNKDHLGNIREVVDEMGNIQQVTNYYPFGTPYSDAQSTINPEFQPFKYNGKEFDMMHGLNTLDYGARQYNPVLPMWDRVDPLAEKYYHISPYMYCLGNPVNYIDPDGKDIHPVTFRKKDNRGNACGESYLSFVKYINAMTALGKTIYGREIIGSFLQKGHSQYGVEGSGKNADCILSIHQYGFDNPTDNFMFMGKNNASFSISEKDGKLNFVLQLDCSYQNQEEITESLLHELTLHGYIVNDIIEAYRHGGIEAAKNIFNSMSESSDHDDLKAQPHSKGGGLYNETAKELIRQWDNLQDIIEKRRKEYE